MNTNVSAKAYPPTSNVPNNSKKTISVREITDHCKKYKGADTLKSIFQLASTLSLFLVSLGIMIYALEPIPIITALLLIPTAGLLIRLFIIQHDCGHGSFFKKKAHNTWTGRLISVLTFTPYDFWRRAHNMHHATSGDLDRRSIGGIDTITVTEYKKMSPAKQKAYRLYRDPILLILIGTPIYTIFLQRIPVNFPTDFYDNYRTLSSESIFKSIMLTNIALVVFCATFIAFFGLKALLLVYLPVLIVTTWIGGWLFYIQHQFEDGYWEYNDEWNINDAGLMGSSYYELPKILQWFSGSIGLHHIHHLNCQIPNYKLQDCMDARPELAEINRLSLKDSLQCIHLKIWCEDRKKMVRFSDI